MNWALDYYYQHYPNDIFQSRDYYPVHHTIIEAPQTNSVHTPMATMMVVIVSYRGQIFFDRGRSHSVWWVEEKWWDGIKAFVDTIDEELR